MFFLSLIAFVGKNGCREADPISYHHFISTAYRHNTAKITPNPLKMKSTEKLSKQNFKNIEIENGK